MTRLTANVTESRERGVLRIKLTLNEGELDVGTSPQKITFSEAVEVPEGDQFAIELVWPSGVSLMSREPQRVSKDAILVGCTFRAATPRSTPRGRPRSSGPRRR